MNMKKRNLKKKFSLKNKIKLTWNEKFLLIILALIILFGLFNKYIFATQRGRISKLKEENSIYEDEKLKIKGILARENIIDEGYVKINRDKESFLLEYFSKLDQSYILSIINDIIDNSNLKVLNIEFGEPELEEIAGLSIATMDITMPYEGNYDELLDFLTTIRTSSRKLMITNLTMESGTENKLLGQIGVKVYSLEGILEDDDFNFTMDTILNTEKQNPFIPYDDYVEEKENDIQNEGKENDEYYVDNYLQIEGTEVFTNTRNMGKNNCKLLENFEDKNIYFIPSNLNIKGSVSRATKSKEGKYSLRVEYNIFSMEEKNRAYVDLEKRNIILKYPPNSIGLWVHSYGYSPVNLGVRFIDQMGEKLDVELSKGIGWIGWKYLKLTPPVDVSNYPLKVDKLYIELGYGRDDFGVLLFDGLDCIYDDNNSYNDYLFYIVNQGDSLESISNRFYGNRLGVENIMRINDLQGNENLRVGKILVIPR